LRVVLVHGFNVRDAGKRTIDTLAEHLEALGHTVDTDTADYGWHSLFIVRFFFKDAVNRIADAIESADAVVTHSNGANYTTKALRKVRNKTTVIHLSPALNSKTEIPDSVRSMHVFRTSNDTTVKWAKWLLWHPWGAMGARGYRGRDFRAHNYDYTDRVNGHSGWFNGDNPKYFAGQVSEILELDL
jgi:hypothetical protein